jgi:hypothetical protein
MKQMRTSGIHHHRYSQRKHLDGAELFTISNEGNQGSVMNLPGTVDDLTPADLTAILSGTPRYVPLK